MSITVPQNAVLVSPGLRCTTNITKSPPSTQVAPPYTPRFCTRRHIWLFHKQKKKKTDVSKSSARCHELLKILTILILMIILTLFKTLNTNLQSHVAPASSSCRGAQLVTWLLLPSAFGPPPLTRLRVKGKCMYFSTKSSPNSEIALRFGSFPSFVHLFFW